MNIIIYSRARGRARQISLDRPLPMAAALVAVALVFVAGFGAARLLSPTGPVESLARMERRIVTQREALESTRVEARRELDALAARLGQLNAHVIRLDALGRRLVTMAGLDDGEFNFDDAPAQGGPEADEPDTPVESAEINRMLNDLALQLEDRAGQLEVLEQLMERRRLTSEQKPEGRPVSSGWLSSYFGKRTDPISGKQGYHRGLDFAGNEGSDVLAVAAGVVTWSGKRYGYGNLVEINHGNGLVTRYAHNQENLVEVGETVKKGQAIAHMGATGRATGAHVHFEVLKDGSKINPLAYVQP